MIKSFTPLEFMTLSNGERRSTQLIKIVALARVQIATKLNLDKPEAYTSHCLKRTGIYFKFVCFVYLTMYVGIKFLADAGLSASDDVAH